MITIFNDLVQKFCNPQLMVKELYYVPCIEDNCFRLFAYGDLPNLSCFYFDIFGRYNPEFHSYQFAVETNLELPHNI